MSPSRGMTGMTASEECPTTTLKNRDDIVDSNHEANDITLLAGAIRTATVVADPPLATDPDLSTTEEVEAHEDSNLVGIAQIWEPRNIRVNRRPNNTQNYGFFSYINYSPSLFLRCILYHYECQRQSSAPLRQSR